MKRDFATIILSDGTTYEVLRSDANMAGTSKNPVAIIAQGDSQELLNFVAAAANIHARMVVDA